MEKAYRVLHTGGCAQIIEKKSRFLATTAPVHTEEEALAFVGEMRKKYWDARHNCYAYIVGGDKQTVRFSDDGEPGQTAGKPILEVLAGAGVADAAIVVTRYFGGVLLGTGGLIRAYTKAAQEGLAASVIVEKTPGFLWELQTDYSGAGKLEYCLAKEEAAVVSKSYTDEVRICALVQKEKAHALKKALTEATNGRAVFVREKEIWFSMPGGKPYIYEPTD